MRTICVHSDSKTSHQAPSAIKAVPLICHLSRTLTRLIWVSKQVKQPPPSLPMTASIPFHWWFMNYLAGQSVCLGPPHTATQPHRWDELMNSELDGVKLGMTWWSVPVIRLVAKLEIDDFIGSWLRSSITINHWRPQVTRLPWFLSAGMLFVYMLMFGFFLNSLSHSP